MKSQIHENQKNTYLRLSKNSIVLLGIALAVFNTSKAADTTRKATEQGDMFSTENIVFEKRNVAPIAEETILNPIAVFSNFYQKSAEEVIAEDNKIIESTIAEERVSFFTGEKSIETIIQENNQIIEGGNTSEIHPLYIDRDIEDHIAEDNAIIENDVDNVAMPLDFEVINKRAFTLKQTLTL